MSGEQNFPIRLAENKVYQLRGIQLLEMTSGRGNWGAIGKNEFLI